MVKKIIPYVLVAAGIVALILVLQQRNKVKRLKESLLGAIDQQKEAQKAFHEALQEEMAQSFNKRFEQSHEKSYQAQPVVANPVVTNPVTVPPQEHQKAS